MNSLGRSHGSIGGRPAIKNQGWRDIGRPGLGIRSCAGPHNNAEHARDSNQGPDVSETVRMRSS
jgi:hypothetical protein